MPCNPDDVTVTEPSGPAASPIPGFGTPFAPSLPSISLPYPTGFPEDLLEIMDLLQFILPSGTIKPPLNPNFGKDTFDGIMKLLDQFFPFLMMYKFFLPILDLIICIIEVLCAIQNPVKLIKALKRLFRTCLPAFLALFPIFALILMLISLLLLILALIEYIIAQILALINLILSNIKIIVKATAKADGPSILSAVAKLGSILCSFQNFFVLFAIFKSIIDLIKDILKLFFKIPPCSDSDSSDEDNCCTTDVCPAFIKNNETFFRTTGTFQYFNQVAVDSGIALPLVFGPLVSVKRPESWQFFDSSASILEAFINITQPYDLPSGVNKVFFPTDGTYNAATPFSQAPYTVDIRLFYEPAKFNRIDEKGARFVRIKDCIVTQAPSTNLMTYDAGSVLQPKGVLDIIGGNVYEDDGLIQVFVDGKLATLQSLIHLPSVTSANPVMSPSDGYTLNDVEYDFKINHEVLLQKALITLGCVPTVALDRAFVNTVFGGDAGLNFFVLNQLVNNEGGQVFPDIGAAQSCLQTALINLRNNMSEAGVATFQAQTTVCLAKLSDDTKAALTSLVGIGFDPNSSSFTIDPNIQFTSQKIQVKVSLNERNGQTLVGKFPSDLASSIASKLSPTVTLGKVGPFSYDGEQFFVADLTSESPGDGVIKMAFDNKMFTAVSIPADINQSPAITEQFLNYTFVYAPSAGADVDGKPARDESDIAEGSE